MDINKITNLTKNLQVPGIFDSIRLNSPKIPTVKPVDRRSRADKREDFENKLSKIDKNQLDLLITFLQEIESENTQDIESRFLNERESLENALIKFSKYITKFQHLNSEMERKLDLKEKELELEASHDWKNKFRLFFFRGMASALLIITLFAIGYIEHTYDWAHLPMSKYLESPSITP